MMEGMDARSSMAVPIGPRSHLGAISVRKTAMPRLMGTAMTIAIIDDTTVPYIAGSAPNSSCTGSHELEVRNLRPNFLMEGSDSLKRMAKMKSMRITTS